MTAHCFFLSKAAYRSRNVFTDRSLAPSRSRNGDLTSRDSCPASFSFSSNRDRKTAGRELPAREHWASYRLGSCPAVIDQVGVYSTTSSNGSHRDLHHVQLRVAQTSVCAPSPGASRRLVRGSRRPTLSREEYLPRVAGAHPRFFVREVSLHCAIPASCGTGIPACPLFSSGGNKRPAHFLSELLLLAKQARIELATSPAFTGVLSRSNARLHHTGILFAAGIFGPRLSKALPLSYGSLRHRWESNPRPLVPM